MTNVISVAGLDASAVASVAMHGTGTPLGDPIEVSALGAALAQKPGSAEPARPAAMGSVKACYGHTEGAAGVTGAFTLSPTPLLPMLHMIPPRTHIKACSL